jgi:hypothetical protein
MVDNLDLDEEPGAAWMAEVLALFFPAIRDIPMDITEAFEQAMWFYSCGKTDEDSTNRGQTPRVVLDYAFDADYIYAAFLSQYGLNLGDMTLLHWWKFRALMLGLKEDEHISKIIGFRSMSESDMRDMSDGEKKYYRKMKRVYALPKKISETERQFHDEIEAALINGGDISAIMSKSGENSSNGSEK